MPSGILKIWLATHRRGAPSGVKHRPFPCIRIPLTDRVDVRIARQSCHPRVLHQQDMQVLAKIFQRIPLSYLNPSPASLKAGNFGSATHFANLLCAMNMMNSPPSILM